MQEAQTTLRAVCPQEFLSAADWKEAQSKPQRLVAKLLPENLWARSYGWHAETREACIVGFLKVPSQACDQVLQASGERGVFFSAVRDKNTPAPSGVRWLPRDDKVTAEVYLQTAQKQAAVAAAPLAFRRGGRASLGIVGEGTTVAESSSLRLRWAAKSVPRHWSPTQFRRMLDAQAWRVVADLQPPARPGGVWTFAAARPEGRSEDCFVLGLEGKSIVIVPWKRSPPKPEVAPLRVSKGWASLSGTRKAQEDGDAAALGEAAGIMDIDAGAGADDDGEATGDEHMEGQGAKRPAQAPAQEQHRQAPKARMAKPEIGQGQGPHGVPLRDHGSNGGDCGLRCLAVTQALRNGMDAAHAAEKAEKLAQSLRVKLHFWMDGHKGWREAWSQDPEATALTEGGEVATTPQDYLASVLCDVIVWKHMAGQWKFMSRVAPPTSAKGKPICLFLMDGHFTTLAHDADVPSSWSELARTAEGEYIPYHGGGKRKQADVEEASVCSSSLSHRLRPVRLGGQAAAEASSEATLKDKESSARGLPQDSEDLPQDVGSGSDLSSWLRPVGRGAASAVPSLGAQSGGGPSVSSGSRPKAVLGNKASSVASSSLSKWLKPQLQEGSRLQVSSGLTQGPVEAASSAVPVAKGPQRPRRQEVHPSSGAAAGEDAASGTGHARASA